ncbi:arsenate reductase ArsC [Thermococcus peptonophilus]|uniref:Arsenate reductase n=1 Tax=Thermococcus peptonophilus TaxID=53952 RepID=A0A142CSS0_9EURY|nr:arsenate reductase ArsC [Thermococcus peptonophilus]AMQ17822.1 arsenate reductase [Thermococcus peptonophilus]
MDEKLILFVCVKNSARSQMAEAFFNHFNDDLRFKAMSAGTEPAEEIDPLARKVMEEIGISLEGQYPKLYTEEMADKAYIVITMGCLDKCPYAPPEKTWDWGLDDPYGQPIEKYREVRDEIKRRVLKLIKDLKAGKSREEIIGKKSAFSLSIGAK